MDIISMRELEEMTADKGSIDAFLEAVREAQDNKDHICIDMVMLKDQTNYSGVINGVSPDDIHYTEKTGCIHVGSWRDSYNITVPETDDIYMADVTTSKDKDIMILQYSFWKDDLSVTFLFTYDETILEEYI